MTTTSTGQGAPGLEGIKPGRLFTGSCVALIATAMTFAILSAIMNVLKQEFLLTNTQVGWITGAGLWGFPISILIFGPLCSVLGMRFLLRLAFVCFLAGVATMVLANGFWMLFFGALTIAFANGLVEGACNPLVATIYPDRKVEKLNNFHVWFPGGIVIGGLLSFLLDQGTGFTAQLASATGISAWQVKLGFILVPTIAYGIIMLGEKYPETERAQSGVSFADMIKETLLRPLFLLLFVCMMFTASVELGPNRWVTAILESGGMPGILVLVYISLLMAVLRQYAGPVVARFSPTGILVMSAVLSGVGLVAISFAHSMFLIFVAATIFAVGVCYFWPTMLGVASERVPKGGEFALALLGFAGNVAVGLLTIPLMGVIIDHYANGKLPYERTAAVIERIADELPAMKEGSKDARLNEAIDETVALAGEVLGHARAADRLPSKGTANVLRGALKVAPDSPVAKEAKELLDPAELYGGRRSFLWVAVLTVVLVVVFGELYRRDRAMGGYRAEKISA